MSDVRLVATNPDDGTLVPVASNASGQLAVQSPTIEKVPNDLDVEGNLTVDGTVQSSLLRVKDETHGSIVATPDGKLEAQDINGKARWTIESNGNGTFTGDLYAANNISSNGYHIAVGFNAKPGNDGYAFTVKDSESTKFNVIIDETGAAQFAGGKAGFTAQGHLWCTTQRGSTVILDATQGGLASWADYTPPTRSTLKEKVEALRDESNTISQDLPET